MSNFYSQEKVDERSATVMIVPANFKSEPRASQPNRSLWESSCNQRKKRNFTFSFSQNLSNENVLCTFIVEGTFTSNFTSIAFETNVSCLLFKFIFFSSNCRQFICDKTLITVCANDFFNKKCKVFVKSS